MRRVLMVSWLFPPHTSIGAKRAWRFARHLPAYGWVPTVLCRRAPPASVFDRSDWSLPPEVRVERSYDAPVFARLTSRASRVSGGAPPPPVEPPSEGLSRSLGARVEDRWSRFVDAMVPTETAVIHAPHALSEMKRLAPGHAVVWTTSYPYHSHELGLRVARARGVPFVADLRDPWTPNWVHQAKYPHTRRIEAALERRVFDAAAAVVVTTEALAALYRARFAAHAHKFVALHNAYDAPPDGLPPALRSDGQISLIHFGNVYGPWSLETLFTALGSLRRDGLPGLDRVRFTNYGKLSDRDRGIASREGVSDLVRVLPALPFAEGLARLRGADLLVLAAWNSPDARLYLQGKLYDYMLAARPVVAESDNPELGDIMARTGLGTTVAPGDVSAMRALLTGVISGAGAAFDPRPDALRYYSAAECSGRLASLLDRVSDSRY